MRDLSRHSPWILAAFLVGMISVAGCGSTTIKTTTETTTKPNTPENAPNRPSRPPDAKPPSQQPPEAAKIGSTLSLTGFDGLKMDVKVTDYLDPATGGEFDQPEQGARFVGVKIELKNTGPKAYDDSPSNGASLITNTNEEADSTIMFGGTCNTPSSVKIAPGDTRNICIPFEVPKAQKGTKFQFTLESGFADQTGEWTLG